MALCLACSCGKNSEEPARRKLPRAPAEPRTATVSPSQGVPPDFGQWPKEKQDRYLRIKAEFDARVAETEKPAKTRALEEAFDAEVKAADQKEMIRPAPSDFAPKLRGPGIKLTLIPKATKLKQGEEFWYRLELQNLGPDTIHFDRELSFWKQGNAEFDKWSFYVTPPGGREERVMFLIPQVDVIGSGGRATMNEAQLRDDAFRSERRSSLHVDLRPGETLLSRAWRYLNDTEIRRIYYESWEPPRVPGEFRELALEDKRTFAKPGTYRIRAVFQDYIPTPPTEEDIQRWMRRGDSRKEAEQRLKDYYKSILKDSLGRFESNTVTIKVGR